MKFSQLALGATVLLVAPISARAATAVASVYWPGDGVVNKHDYRTSSGEQYSATAMTCAHKTFPLGTKLIVRYGDNYAEVKVNDRGPFIKGRDIDLTPGVAKSLHFSGLGRVRIEPFPPLPQPRPADLP